MNGSDETELTEGADTFAVYASEPGNYRLSIVVRRGGDTFEDVRIKSTQPTEVRMPKGVPEKTIGVLIPTETLQKAIDK